jgi:acyl-CoA synthetase (AMP-forming)/AMP-acid ligase II
VETISELLMVGDDESPALLDVRGGTLTYRELREKTHVLSSELRMVGVAPRDRMAMVLPNGPDMAITFLAAVDAGCAAPLNPKYREAEFRFYMTDLNAKVLLVPDGGHSEAEAAAGEDLVVLRTRGAMDTFHLGVSGIDSEPSGSHGPTRDDVALVLHTSGTTSRPKLVPLRQRNLVASAQNIAASLALEPSDRSLNVMPLFHIHGLLAGLLAPLSVGASVICTPGFDAFRFHGWVDEFGPTYSTALPTMHQMVLARAESHQSTSLRFIRSSSASLPSAVTSDLQAMFGVPVVEAYGMTEASHQMATNPLPPGERKSGSVGRAAGIEISVLDHDGSILPTDERGEVSVRGTTILDGYENNEEANRAAFTEDGWFRTGDEGHLDKDGYLFLTGRIKEQINRGGEKIAPLEIDEVMMSHPAVAQAVAFAVPDSVLGEAVAAAIVLRDGSNLTVADLRKYVSAQMAAFKVPRHVFFVDEIPKGPTGKVQRIGLAKALGVSDE